jgi:SAM-dependent methyltransferase
MTAATSSPPIDLLWPHAHAHPLLAALGVSAVAGASWDTAIHPGDEMFEFGLREADGDWNRAFFHYVRSGLLGYATMAQVLDAFEAVRGPVGSVFDFASGYGRTTRFLLPRLGRERLWVADIQPGAVEFQEKRFGVRSLLSTTAPEDLEIAERFDVVFVLSLFSHLPPSSFRRWLAKLGSLLTPRGVLVFSTLGEEVAPPEHPLGESGFAFWNQSESAVVSREEYGTMWVRPDFVAAAIAEGCGPGAVWQHFPRRLWHLQDVYVVARTAASALPGLALRAGPVGFLDELRTPAANVLELRGWAHDPDGVEEPRVRIEIGGEPARVVGTGAPRPDVAASWRDARAARSGWTARCELPAAPPPGAIVAVTACAGGRELCLHSGTLEGSMHRFGHQQAEAELRRARGELDAQRAAFARTEAARDELAQRIAWMEQSRFWKLRNLWFRLKGKS